MIKCKICRENNLNIYCHACNMLTRYYEKRKIVSINCKRCGEVFLGTVGRRNCEKCKAEIREKIKICKVCGGRYKGKKCCMKEKKIERCNCGGVAISKGMCRKCYDKVRYILTKEK